MAARFKACRDAAVLVVTGGLALFFAIILREREHPLTDIVLSEAALGAFTAAYYAYRQSSAATSAARAAAESARLQAKGVEAQLAQLRPYVVVERFWTDGQILAGRIANVGAGLATCIRFDGGIEAAYHRQPSPSLQELGYKIRGELPALGPGQHAEVALMGLDHAPPQIARSPGWGTIYYWFTFLDAAGNEQTSNGWVTHHSGPAQRPAIDS